MPSLPFSIVEAEQGKRIILHACTKAKITILNRLFIKIVTHYFRKAGRFAQTAPPTPTATVKIDPKP